MCPSSKSSLLTFIFVIQSALPCISLSIPPPLFVVAKAKCGKRKKALPNRRDWLFHTTGIILTTAAFPIGPSTNKDSSAAETVGKDAECNDSTCLGVWDGLLADCPHSLIGNYGAGCASSQGDTPGIFAEPWDYSEAPNTSIDWEQQMGLLVPTIELIASRRGDQVKMLLKSGRYVRFVFIDKNSGEESIGEFYFTPNDTTVQFRMGSLAPKGGIFSSSLKNLERCEMIRKELRYLKVPVMRNRRRTFFFGESDFDTFGPGSAALGPPAEMSFDELEGKQ